jgi:hypothetical protein
MSRSEKVQLGARVSTEIRDGAKSRAAGEGVSLNVWVERTLGAALAGDLGDAMPAPRRASVKPPETLGSTPKPTGEAERGRREGAEAMNALAVAWAFVAMCQAGMHATDAGGWQAVASAGVAAGAAVFLFSQWRGSREEGEGDGPA